MQDGSTAAGAVRRQRERHLVLAHAPELERVAEALTHEPVNRPRWRRLLVCRVPQLLEGGVGERIHGGDRV